MTRRLKLTNGLYALVDDEDFAQMSIWSWSSTSRGRMVYAMSHKGYMHRLVLNAKRGQMIDHRNRNGLDNRKENLRTASKKENAGNSVPRPNKGSSGFRGVHRHSKNRKWVAQIHIKERPKYLGSFEAEEEAALAYDRVARRHFGSFAFLNFPEVSDYSNIYTPRRRRRETR